MKDDRLLAMRVFQTVAETGGFTAAAQALGVSQPFISQTIARLEDRLGVSLLHRTTRGHSLTAEGIVYLDGCRRAIDGVEQAEAALQTSPDQVAGILRVSAPLAFGLDRVTPILPVFLERHPKVELDLVLTDDSVNLVEDRIDLAIRMGQLTDSTLRARRLCDLRRIVVAAPALVAKYGAPQSPADLARFPCLCWDGARAHLNQWQFTTPAGPVRFEAEGRFRSNAGMALFQMCRDGVGIMRCAEHLARPAIAQGALVALLEDFTQPDDSAFHAVFLPQRSMQPRVRFFLDFLVESFQTPEW
ncbi:MAG: LysR family transcriptional regulator [Rhodobacteraceae bacterium]|nr:LysR family transcriptional regulator [Paracoccaceae bacterium]